MLPVTILVVEDEDAIVTLLKFNLEKAGFRVLSCGSAEEGQKILNKKLPDIILLDWMLPGMSGVQFIEQLKQNNRTADLPIILLTARGTDIDKELGLNQGADDYITKPFSTRELIARINTILRRYAPQKTAEVIQIHHLTLNPLERRVSCNNKELNLGPTEFKLLHFFMTHPERVYSRRQLLDFVWGDHIFVEERTVDVHIRRLRKHLEEINYAQYIQTMRSAGYRFSTKLKE